MTTTLCRTPVRASIPANLVGVSVFESRPALIARPAGEPCEVRIKNRTSFSASNPLAATCNDLARASIVALPPFLEFQQQNVVLGVQPIGCDLQRLGQGVDRCTSALLGIVLHVDRASVEAVRYDLCRASSLASKHAL